MQKYFYHVGINPTMVAPDTLYGVFDRTRTLFELPQIELYSPIGKLVTPKSIDQLCHERVADILKKAGDRRINIAYSGGIDSTLVLAEFLKQAPHDQITVMLNEHSIDEYPHFYRQYIENKLHQIRFTFHSEQGINLALKDGIIVTGLLFDQSFGSSQYTVLPKETLKQSIEEFLRPLNKKSQETYSKLIAACPRKIENTKDLLWWVKYTLDYQNEEFLWLTEVEDLILEKNIFHFANTPDWNDYAISTPTEVKYPGYHLPNYKLPLKEQLHEFTKDDVYTAYKVKVNSWRRYRTHQQRLLHKAIYIKTDWTRGWSIQRTKQA